MSPIIKALRMHIAHLPVCSNVPTLDRVHTTRRNQGRTTGLHVTRFIETAALQNYGLSIPSPRQVESGMALRQNGILQDRLHSNRSRSVIRMNQRNFYAL